MVWWAVSPLAATSKFLPKLLQSYGVARGKGPLQNTMISHSHVTQAAHQRNHFLRYQTRWISADWALKGGAFWPHPHDPVFIFFACTPAQCGRLPLPTVFTPIAASRVCWYDEWMLSTCSSHNLPHQYTTPVPNLPIAEPTVPSFKFNTKKQAILQPKSQENMEKHSHMQTGDYRQQVAQAAPLWTATTFYIERGIAISQYRRAKRAM